MPRHAAALCVVLFASLAPTRLEGSTGGSLFGAQATIEQTVSPQTGSGVNAFDGASHGVISGNLIRGHVAAIDIDDAPFVTVTGNVIAREGLDRGMGILVRPATTFPSFATIQGNYIGPSAIRAPAGSRRA